MNVIAHDLPEYHYRDMDGKPMIYIPYRDYTANRFSRTRIHVLQPFTYAHPDFPEVYCPVGEYDGFSVSRPLSWLTFGILKPVMPVMESTYPHDIACIEKHRFTRRQRREIFKVAYDDAVFQFHNGVRPDRRRDLLVKGVSRASKILRTC